MLVGGKARIRAGGRDFGEIGERMGPFEGKKPVAVYVPWQSDYRVEATTDLELGICSAPGGGNHAARLIGPDQVAYSKRGQGSNTRHVHDILPESEPAHSLLVVEVITPAGGWSSYPSHKHDTDNLPHERELQETYYHRLEPAPGLRLAAGLHRRPRAGRDHGGRGRRRRAGAQGLSPLRHGARLRPLLPERDGRPEADLALQHRTLPSLAARRIDPAPGRCTHSARRWNFVPHRPLRLLAGRHSMRSLLNASTLAWRNTHVALCWNGKQGICGGETLKES